MLTQCFPITHTCISPSPCPSLHLCVGFSGEGQRWPCPFPLSLRRGPFFFSGYLKSRLFSFQPLNYAGISRARDVIVILMHGVNARGQDKPWTPWIFYYYLNISLKMMHSAKLDKTYILREAGIRSVTRLLCYRLYEKVRGFSEGKVKKQKWSSLWKFLKRLLERNSTRNQAIH